MAGRGGGGLGTVARLFRSGTASGLSDEQLLERFASRHDEAAEAAFAAIVERHGPMVLGVCRRILTDAHDAHDAFQATFLVLVRHAGTVVRRKSLASWLYGVALRVSARSRAASARRRVVERRAVDRRPPSFEPIDDRGEVWDEVERLPENLRVVVVLCYLEGLTHEQAAGRLAWPVGTVRSRLARARDRLRGRLARRGFEPARALAVLPLGRPTIASLPTALVEPTVKAAMLFSAHSAFEVGLVSASVVSLTEGVFRAMIITKIQTAGVALATVLFVASASVFAYQDGVFVHQDGDALNGNAGTPAKAAQTKPGPSPRARKMASYPEAIEKFARLAGVAQARGELERAAEHTETLQRLSHEWNWMVRHSDSDRFPDSAYEPAKNPPSTYEFVAPAAEVAPGGPRSLDAGAQERIERVERKLDQILQALAGLQPSNQPALDPSVLRPSNSPASGSPSRF